MNLRQPSRPRCRLTIRPIQPRPMRAVALISIQASSSSNSNSSNCTRQAVLSELLTTWLRLRTSRKEPIDSQMSERLSWKRIFKPLTLHQKPSAGVRLYRPLVLNLISKLIRLSVVKSLILIACTLRLLRTLRAVTNFSQTHPMRTMLMLWTQD